jgi:hypothetical protein
LQEKDTALFNLEKSLGEKEQEIERLKEQLHLLRHHQFAKKVRAPIGYKRSFYRHKLIT